MATEQTAGPLVDPEEEESGDGAPNEIKSAPGISSVTVSEGKRRAFSKTAADEIPQRKAKAHAAQKLVHRTKKGPRAPKRPLSA